MNRVKEGMAVANKRILQSRPTLFEHGLLPIPSSMPSVEQLCELVARGGEGRISITAWHKIAKESFKMDTVSLSSEKFVQGRTKSSDMSWGSLGDASPRLHRSILFKWCRFSLIWRGAAEKCSQSPPRQHPRRSQTLHDRPADYRRPCYAFIPSLTCCAVEFEQGYAQLVFEIFFDCLDGQQGAGGEASYEGSGDANDVDATEFAIYLFVLGSYRCVALIPQNARCLPTPSPSQTFPTSDAYIVSSTTNLLW